MSRADAERASRMIDYSRAGAFRRAEKYGEGRICVPLALDNAAEEAELDVELAENVYLDKIEGRLRSFGEILELVGGHVVEHHYLSDWLRDIEKRDDFGRLVISRVRGLLQRAKARDTLAVINFGEVKGNKGHVAYIKLGKEDPNKVYVFDFFGTEDVGKEYGYGCLDPDPKYTDFVRYYFDPSPKYDTWVTEFVIEPKSEFWCKPDPSEV